LRMVVEIVHVDNWRTLQRHDRRSPCFFSKHVLDDQMWLACMRTALMLLLIRAAAA
jgi:hypothetical protein